jgi:hypothetical protein
MRKLRSILVFFLALSFSSQAKEIPVSWALLTDYLQTDTGLQPESNILQAFAMQLEKKKDRFSNDQDFIRHLFYKTHNRFLKTFEPQAGFASLLSNGRYNCLTGTAVYSLLLTHFEIPHAIIQTNYHIFILVEADHQTILLEATDPLAGFVTDKSLVEVRLKSYREQNLLPNQTTTDKANGVHYQFQFSLWETVSPQALTGLLYFNQAVKAFNNQLLEKSVDFLEKASRYDATERITEFAALIKLAIATGQLTEDDKMRSLKKLGAIRKRASGSLAASLGN